MVNPLPLDPTEILIQHIKMILNIDLNYEDFVKKISCDFSKRTGRIKNFKINNILFATLRKEGAIVLTMYGAKMLINHNNSIENCVIPNEEIIPFIMEGRSLFCKHVKWCGSNIKIGSEVIVIDDKKKVIAIGKAVCPVELMKKYHKGVAVKIREGLKSREG